MRKRLVLWLMAIAGYVQVLKAQERSYPVNAIAFYNFENFFNPADNPDKDDDDFTPQGPYRYTDVIFHKKAHSLATVLQQLGGDICPGGPAIIGCAEVEDETALKVLLEQPELKDRRYRYLLFDGPDRRGINVALLYRPDQFRVLQAKPLPVNLKYAGGGITRDILMVKGILSGDTIYVLVNHWPSRAGGESASAPKRAAAAEVCRQATEQVLSEHPAAKLLIMGDLNDDPVSPSVAQVLGAGGKTGKKQGILYNPWLSYYKKGIGTLCHDDHWNLFDQIILSEGWLQAGNGHWQYFRSEIFDRDFLKTSFGKYKGYPHRSFNGTHWINGYSDHFPTLIYIVKDAPQQDIR